MKVVENSEVRSKEVGNQLSVIGIEEQIRFIENQFSKFADPDDDNIKYLVAVMNSLGGYKWMIEMTQAQLMKLESNQPTEPGQVEELVDTLKKMKAIIRGWHGIGHRNPEEEKAMWEVYDRKSPEMKMINEVLEKYSDSDEKGAGDDYPVIDRKEADHV